MVDLEKPDEDAGLAKRAAYVAANLGVGLAGAVAGGGVGAGVGTALNKQAIRRGKEEMVRQLKTQEFADVELGRMTRDDLRRLNEVRLKEDGTMYNGKVAKINDLYRDNAMMVTKEQMKHIYDGRVEGNSVTPEDVAESVARVMSSKNPIISGGKKPGTQEIADIRADSKHADVLYVSGFKRKPEGALSKFLKAEKEFTGVVTTMKKEKKRLLKK